MTLAPLSRTEFAIYDLWTGKSSSITFRLDPDGTVEQLMLEAHGRQIPAVRAR